MYMHAEKTWNTLRFSNKKWQASVQFIDGFIFAVSNHVLDILADQSIWKK